MAQSPNDLFIFAPNLRGGGISPIRRIPALPYFHCKIKMEISSFRDQMEEIRRILSSSSTKSQKPFVYSTFLRLQELATIDSALVQLPVDSAEAFVSLILADISDDDEEM